MRRKCREATQAYKLALIAAGYIRPAVTDGNGEKMLEGW